jgi:hypothetical protein
MKPINKKDQPKYQLRYNHYLSWGKRVHVLKEGTIVKDRHGKLYLVRQVIKSPIANEHPRIVLESVNEQ